MLRKAVLLAIVAFYSLALAQDVSISRENRLKVFDKTWETVNKKFYDPKFNSVDWAAMKQKYRPLAEAASDKIELGAVINRMLAELKVSHLSVNHGIWFGTGISYIRLGEQADTWVVRIAYAGSPAKTAGIERGWHATAFGGDCNTLAGKVTNTFLDKQGQEHKTEVPCQIIRGDGDPVPPAARMLNETTFYVRFPEFSKKSASFFKEQVNAHRSASALVIDLRGNPGGDIDYLGNCLSLLFPQKFEAVKAYGRNGKERKWKVGGSSVYGGRVFVLTNRESGSASEIFAAVIQETGRGVVVGRATKREVLGSVTRGVSNGFKLHMPIYDFRTAKGTRLEGLGVIPDEPVTMTVKDYQENKDSDLDRVLAILAAKK